MKPLYALLLPLAFAATLVGCKDAREELIESRLNLEQGYEQEVSKLVEGISTIREDVPKEKIERVVRDHYSLEQARQHALDLYSETNFTDAEFTLVMDARERILAGNEPTAEQRPAAEKFASIIAERFKKDMAEGKGKEQYEALLAELDD